MSKVSEQESPQAQADIPAVITALYQKFGESSFVRQHTAEGMPTLWLGRDKLLEVLSYLKSEYTPRFEMLLDVTAIDERVRVNRAGQPDSADGPVGVRKDDRSDPYRLSARGSGRKRQAAWDGTERRNGPAIGRHSAQTGFHFPGAQPS